MYFPKLQYPVTRNYSVLFTICTFIGFALIAGLLAAVNFAADGYQTLTVLSADFNTTQTFWYNKVVPSFFLPSTATNRQCQPYAYHVGEIFRTTNKIFNWQIDDVMGQVDDSGNYLPGNIHSFMPYSNVPLDYCDVMNVYIDADLVLRTATARVQILCQLPSPLVASTVIVSSEVPTRASAMDVPWLTSYNSSYDWSPQLNVSEAVNLLGWDVLIQMLAMYELSGGAAPTLLETRFDYRSYTDGYCPAAFVGTGNWCSDADNAALPLFTVDGGDWIGFDNFTSQLDNSGNLSDYTIAQPPYWNPIRNFLRSAHAAARADLGSFRPSNMFQNMSMIPIAINTTGFVVVDGAVIENTLTAATMFSSNYENMFSGLPMPASNGTLIDTSYVCNRQFLKSPVALFFAITSGTLSNVLWLWGLWMLLCSRWVKAANPHMNTCHYHALEAGMTAQGHGNAITLRNLKRNRRSEDWTYTRASTDGGQTPSKSPWSDESRGLGQQYPPPPSWMLNLPNMPYNRGDQSYSSVRLEDLSPESAKARSPRSF